jgi:hypothetical protein
MTVFDTLATVLAGCGATINQPKNPRTAAVKALPSIEFFRVSSNVQFFQNGTKLLTQDRIQVNLSASTYAGLETLLASVRAVLDNDRTDFILSFPLGVNVEGNDQNPQIYWLAADWLILY